MIKTILLIISLLVFGFIVLLLNTHIDQSPTRNQLSITYKDNQPCFYIDDDSFTQRLAQQIPIRIWVEDLAVLGRQAESQHITFSYPEKLMLTPRDKNSCFFLPNPSDLTLNNPYNILISTESNLNFCLTPINNGFIATQVKFQADPNHEKNATPICIQEPFEEKRTMAETIKKWLITF